MAKRKADAIAAAQGVKRVLFRASQDPRLTSSELSTLEYKQIITMIHIANDLIDSLESHK